MTSYKSKRYRSRCNLGIIDNVLSWIATYGYFAGGYTSGSTNSNTTDRIQFSNGVTSANSVSNLSQARDRLAGLSDVSLYGYFAGGETSVAHGTAIADRILFSDGITSANTVSNLSQARGYLVGLSDRSTYGYFAGGYIGSSTYVSTTDRIQFSDGVTAANTISNLSSIRGCMASCSDGNTYGYFAGGATTNEVTNWSTNVIDRITFSNGTTAVNTASNLSGTKRYLAGLSDGSTYGYFAGGYTWDTILATADRITFSTSIASANTVSNLKSARFGLAGLSDGSTYGYFAGGHTGAIVATTDKITFSSGATVANTVSNLSVTRVYLTGLSDFAV
jgi:hypothetical protein